MAATAAQQAERARERPDRQLALWLRRELNRDLRRWRPAAREPGPQQPDAIDRVADCKAKLEILRWADSWAYGLEHNLTGDPRIESEMQAHFAMIKVAIRKLGAGYSHREGWRDEWG